jgi:chromosome segregation ATPase
MPIKPNPPSKYGSPLPKVTSNSQAMEQFLKELDVVNDEVQKLLRDVRENESNFIRVQVELSTLCKDIKELSKILRGGDSSMSLITKVILLEENFKQLDEKLDELIDSKAREEKERNQVHRQSMVSFSDIELANKSGSWKVKTVVASGVCGIIIAVITAIAQMVK